LMSWCKMISNMVEHTICAAIGGLYSCQFHLVGYLVRTRVQSSVIGMDRARDGC
jgi:hypothetical protein